MDDSKDSKLPKPEQRFLSYMLGLARQADVAVLTKEAIVEKITCMGIMNGKDAFPGFKDSQERRADLIVACVGTKRNSALETEPEDAGRQLQRALKVNDTNLVEIFDAVGDDDFVKTQNPEELWGLLTAAEWWKQSTPQAKLMMAKTLKVVVIEHLLDERGAGKKSTFYEMIKIIGISLLASRRIPVEINEKVYERMLELGEANKAQPMNAKELLAILKPEVLVEHLDLTDLYRVIEEVAFRYKFQIKEEPKAPEAAPAETAAETAAAGNEIEEALEVLDESARLTNRPPVGDQAPVDGPAVELSSDSEADLPSLETLVGMSKGQADSAVDDESMTVVHSAATIEAARAAATAGTREDSGLNRMPQPPKPPNFPRGGRH